MNVSPLATLRRSLFTVKLSAPQIYVTSVTWGQNDGSLHAVIPAKAGIQYKY